MQLATVVGQVVSTVKVGGLDNLTLLVLRPAAVDGSPVEAGSDLVAVDLVGAGDGDVVLVVRGGAARVGLQTATAPTDAAVVAIVDSVIQRGSVTYRTS
jgi:ethanolamine utilization protein EutN